MLKRGLSSFLPLRLTPFRTILLLLSLLPTVTQAGWQMTFNDAFSGSSLDKSKWITTDAWGSRGYGKKGELECYMPDAFWFGHGIVSIVAQRKFTAVCRPPSQPGPTYYTSGMMTTYGKFQQRYGYFEMRAKLPKGKGLWPAFWLLAGDKTMPPEIDILEAIGSAPLRVFQAIHYMEGGAYKTHLDWILDVDATAAFHTYGVDWKPGYLAFYSDGIKRSEFFSGAVPNKPYYILLNLATGGEWPGAPDSTTPFPSTFQVDYVRVYKRVNNGKPDGTPPFGQVGGGGGTPSPSILLSYSPTRSNAVPLDQKWVSGNIYVFTSPDTGVASVQFKVDGSTVKMENLAPFDLGGAANGSALPFNASGLAKGSHTLNAQVKMTDGSTRSVTANFFR